MREQYELTFLIGFDIYVANSRWRSFEREVIATACKLCGGCAVIPTEGYWMSDGATPGLTTFAGNLQREYTLNIKLTCELHKEAYVYASMRDAIIAHARYYGIDTDWVHVQRTKIDGLHFSVKGADMSAATLRDIVSPGTRGARP